LKCLYRNWSKCTNTTSQEHVLPQALGGNIKSANPFAIRNICSECNSLCGLYIDGPFIRSWFTQGDRARFALRYIDINSKPVVPLTYMGIVQDLMYKDKICEIWLGPTGDSIFHFHRPYPEEPDKEYTIGVPPHITRENIDEGFTFLFVSSNNPVWHPVIFNSFVFHFNKSVNYLGNGLTPIGGGFRDIPDELIKLKDILRELMKDPIRADFRINDGWGDRFLAKMALGIGKLVLKPEFQESKSADLLRSFMWEKNIEKRKQLNMIHSGFLSNNNDSSDKHNELFSWPGGHFIAVIKTGISILLHMILYEKRSATIEISNEPNLLDCPVTSGFYYVIVPSLQRAVGPKKLHTYITHISGYKDKELENLEMEMNKNMKLPPFKI